MYTAHQPQFPGYPPQPQQFPAQTQQFPAQPEPVTGSLDEFYDQPTAGGGKSVSWKDRAIGYTVQGVVSRDVNNGDITQQTNYTTKAPEFYRDGRPKFVMRVPLTVAPSEEFPEGEASLYIRGLMRDELVRAMTEAGTSGAPKRGDFISVTLAEKKVTAAGPIPANIFRITYQPANKDQTVLPSDNESSQTQPTTETVQPEPVQSQPQPPAGLTASQAELMAKLSGGAA